MGFAEDSAEPLADDALVGLRDRAQAAWVARWTRSWGVRHPGGALVEVSAASASTWRPADPLRWLRLDPDAPPCERRPGQPRALRAQLDEPCWRLALRGRPALILAIRALDAWPRARQDAALRGLAEALPCGSELICRLDAAQGPPAHPRLHLVERRAPLDLGALPDPPAWAPLAGTLAWLTAPALGATALWRLAVRSDGAW